MRGKPVFKYQTIKQDRIVIPKRRETNKQSLTIAFSLEAFDEPLGMEEATKEIMTVLVCGGGKGFREPKPAEFGGTVLESREQRREFEKSTTEVFSSL